MNKLITLVIFIVFPQVLYAQKGFDNFYISTGYGVNQLKTQSILPLPYKSSSYTENRFFGFNYIPIYLGYNNNLINGSLSLYSI